MTRCAHCAHYDTTTHPKHWALGMGACPVTGPDRTEGGQATIFVHVTHQGECDKFRQATDEVIQSRREQYANSRRTADI